MIQELMLVFVASFAWTLLDAETVRFLSKTAKNNLTHVEMLTQLLTL